MSISARPHTALQEKTHSLIYLDYLKYKSNQDSVLRENFESLDKKLAFMKDYPLSKQLNLERAFIIKNSTTVANIQALEGHLDKKIVKNASHPKDYIKNLIHPLSTTQINFIPSRKYKYFSDHYENLTKKIFTKLFKKRTRNIRVAKKHEPKSLKDKSDIIAALIDRD
jgi:hypothetical protein